MINFGSIVKGMSKQPLFIAILGGLIVFILVSGFVPTLAIFGPTTYTHDCIVDGSLVGEVSGEITLNQDEYATAWKPDSGILYSEAISIDTWKITYDITNQDLPFGAFGWGLGVPNYHYEVYINNEFNQRGSDHVGGGDFTSDDTGLIGTTTLVSVPDIYLPGEYPDGSVLRVELIANISAIYLQPIPPEVLKENSWIDIKLAEYNSKLVSGKGLVSIGGSLPDVVEEGTELRFNLETGNSVGYGWTVYIEPPLSRTDLTKVLYQEDGFTGQDNFGPKTVTWNIPVGWFTLGGDNQCRITLANDLFEGVLTTWWVVDDIELIPDPDPDNPTGVISDVDGQAYTGETMTVFMSAIPNPISQSPISYFVVYVYYGQPGSMPGTDFMGEYIIFNGHYPADTSGKASMSFVIPQNKPGQITIKANAVDQAGRSSLGDFWSMTAVNQGEDPEPPGPEPVDYPFTWTLSALIVAMIGIIIVGLIAFVGFGLPPNIRIIVVIIVGLILAFLVWYLGKHPGGLI